MPFYADLDADAGLVRKTLLLVPAIVVTNTVVPVVVPVRGENGR